MSEPKKPSLFQRLLRLGDDSGEAPPPVPPASTLAPPPASLLEPAPRPDLPAAPPPVTEDAEPPLGPPETTPEFIAAQAPEPEPVPPVPAASPPLDFERPPPVPPERMAWFRRLTTGLRRSSDQLSENLAAVFVRRKLDAATLDDLEDVLIQADLGVATAEHVVETLRRERFDRDVTAADVRAVLAAEIERILVPVARPLVVDAARKPFVILMIGVNGSGKTTTIGKLAGKFAAEGRRVTLAAGDTFRAAAIEQLEIWGARTGAPVITRPAGSDASGLAFEAVTRARAEGADVLIIDTAGRLQNRDELMGELEKMIRVIKKVDPTAPHATVLTLDATTGQNALNQVEIFGQRAGVTGLVMTKLDSTARGGILVAIAQRHGLPVHFIGVGEGIEDLEAFEAGDFAAAIAGRTQGSP